MLFKFKTGIRRFFGRFFKLHRPASYPYITGDGFRSIANFIFDQFLDFDPSKVSYGDIVFVRTSHIKDFFTSRHPFIKESYVLISHNEDSSVGEEFLNNLDEKILHWYAENLTFKHPKATALPIGIQNFVVGKDEDFFHHFQHQQLTSRKDAASNGTIANEKLDRIIFGFTVGENMERKELSQILASSGIADHIEKPREEYYKTLRGYKFIASPKGAGLDCHRTWEALHYRVIPILLRNNFSEQIFELGYPVLLVDSWHDITSMTSESLADYYEIHKNKFDTSQMFIQYWYDRITKHRSS